MTSDTLGSRFQLEKQGRHLQCVQRRLPQLVPELSVHGLGLQQHHFQMKPRHKASNYIIS